MDIRFGARAAARPALGSQDHKKRNGRDLHLLPQELDHVAFKPDDKLGVFVTSSLFRTEMKKGQSANQMLSSNKEFYEN